MTLLLIIFFTIITLTSIYYESIAGMLQNN
jgi:hypothetical protein